MSLIMKTLKAALLAVFMLLTSTQAYSQVEMADTMRSEGKIYVVVAMIVVILAGLFIYLFLLDRKIKKLENQLKDRHRPN